MIAILDYGVGNLFSLRSSLQQLGLQAVVTADAAAIRAADRLILPGVGAFGDAMAKLTATGLVPVLKEQAEEKPLLGICLGMQLLAERGYEVCECEGLGYIPGEIVRFEQTQAKERIPHVGWNDIEKRVETPLFDGIEDGTNYYFVHSYHFKVRDEENIAAVTPYCGEFVSAVAKDHIVGTQFHPEKSQKAGFRLIKNFLAM